MSKLWKTIVTIVVLASVAVLLNSYVNIPGVNYVVFVPIILSLRIYTERKAVYREWLIATLSAVLYLFLSYCMDSEGVLAAFIWTLVGAFVSLVGIFGYRCFFHRQEAE